MEGCVEKLGTLYDDLAGIQAEVKVNGMSSGLLFRIKDLGTSMLQAVWFAYSGFSSSWTRKSKAVKRQCMSELITIHDPNEVQKSITTWDVRMC